MGGKKKYIPISELPRLLRRDMTAVVNEKPAELKLTKEEFHRKKSRDKETKIVERYENTQRRVIERAVPRERPLMNNRQTGENARTTLSGINKQEPVRKGKSMAEIQEYHRRPIKVNAPRRMTVPDVEQPLIKRSAGKDRTNFLPTIVQKNTIQEQKNTNKEQENTNKEPKNTYKEQKNVQSKSRLMSASGGRSSPKDLSIDVSRSKSGMKNLKCGFTDDEKRKSRGSSADSNGKDDQKQILGVSVDELEGVHDFYKWKIEQLRVKEERLFKKAVQDKKMSGEAADCLREEFEVTLLLKQREVLDELAERQREQHRMEQQRLEKTRQEAAELEKRAENEEKGKKNSPEKQGQDQEKE